VALEVWHLEGGERGRRESFAGATVRIGSGPGSDLHLPGAAGVLPDHAEIVQEGGRVYLRPKGAVRLNGRLAGEAVLKDGDLLELGDDVHLRIRLVTDGAQEFETLLARAPTPAHPAPVVPARLWHGRLGAAVTVLFALILVGGPYLAAPHRPKEELAQTLARERRLQEALRARQEEAYTQRMKDLGGELRSLERRMADRTEVDARVGEVKRAVAEVESNVLERVSSELEASAAPRPELDAVREAVRRLEEQDAAAGRLIRTYGPSVCLVEGSYGFGKMKKGEWRFLREISQELVKDLDLQSDKVPLTMDEDGPVFQVQYTGTGFLVDAQGLVLTNRHIAEPWWKNDSAEQLINEGYEARFLHLRAYFPGHASAFEFDLSGTLLSETTDLALLRFQPEGPMPPALKLADPKTVMPGRRVLLLGYPSGLDALIARTEEEFARSITHDGGAEPTAVLDALAERGLVRPLPTQGFVSDVLADKLLFDAPTAVGGSGGPLLDMDGRVVAINYGILKAFSGANFGVPAHHAVELLQRAAEQKDD